MQRPHHADIPRYSSHIAGRFASGGRSSVRRKESRGPTLSRALAFPGGLSEYPGETGGRGRASAGHRGEPDTGRETRPMTIELHVFPPSPRAFKVLAAAHHLEIPYDLKFVDFTKGEQRTAEFAALNPNCRMPVLKDGDFVLWESNAILQYLAGRRPEAGLFPEDEKARLDVTRWQFWDLAHWDPPCSVFVFENLVKQALLGIDRPDEAALAKAAEPFHRAATVLNRTLERHSYVTGDRLTLADFSLGAVVNLTERAQLPLEPYPAIRRWHAALRALPAWGRTLAMSAPPA
jgi:glutathione S-transferase